MENSPLRGLWQFPATVSALSLLSKPLSFPPPSPSALEAALHSPSNNSQLLSDLHGRLLGLSLGASAAAKWLTSTARFVRTHLEHFTHPLAGCVGCDREHISEDVLLQFPTDENGYTQLSVITRLLVLHTMAELVIAYHDSLLSAGNFNMYAVEEIRFASFGTDALGNAYWYFNDFERVYREPSQKAREKAEKLLRAEQQAREKESQRVAKAEKRRAVLQKKEEQKKRREERIRRNAEKWAPRVAATRVTRAAKRAESQMAQNTELKLENHPVTNRSSARRKRTSEKASLGPGKADDEESDTQRPWADSITVLDGVSSDFTQNNNQTSRRGGRGRRRKAQNEPASQIPPPKRPRKIEMKFSDPNLRICTHWEVLTTDAGSLRELIDRFSKEEQPTAMERALVKRLTESILPEIEEHEAKRRRELERKERAEFLMINQKRSSRVQAIAERKEMEARQAAQREEELRFEEERLAAHNSRVIESLALEEKNQSKAIRLARKQFGLMDEVARDEENLLKNDTQMKKQLRGFEIRRSARSTKGNKMIWKERSDLYQDGGGKIPTAIKDGPEPIPVSVQVFKNDTTNPASGVEQTQPDSEITAQIDCTRSNGEIEVRQQGVFSETLKTEASQLQCAEEALSKHRNSSEEVESISDCPLETLIAKEYQWEYNHDEGMPVFVLDKFFFAYRSSFNDAPLEDSDLRGADMIGLGILVPPSISEPHVSRVEIPSIMEWVIEYGTNPKLWVKSKYAWYELRRPAIEYRDAFTSARRKYELCVRIAIIGETMRGPQLRYDSIVNFLSMRYGDMKSYKESDILEERAFIVGQMKTLNRRSLMQSGFLRTLCKKLREDERKAQHARERAQKAEAASKLKGLKDDSVFKTSLRPGVKAEVEKISSTQSVEVKTELSLSATKGSEEKAAPKKRRKRPNSAGKVVVPRAVSSIITSLINTATKSSKFARKRKRASSLPIEGPNVKISRYEKDSCEVFAPRELKKTGDKNTEDMHEVNNGLSHGDSVEKSEEALAFKVVPNSAIQTPQTPKQTDALATDDNSLCRPENGKNASQPEQRLPLANGTRNTFAKDCKMEDFKPVTNGLMNGKVGEECGRTETAKSPGKSLNSCLETNGTSHIAR
eukprot:TRINITY_DN2914_c0_g1_i1.p1 TRINITY_DN2914_c0_g1~~TRINITY_DN2914_c0_g1_i1.p1  ORF type:complete len:1123 (+),score=213.04 TRINITY_DN2914_c0_g1_i1:376-3744(+)